MTCTSLNRRLLATLVLGLAVLGPSVASPDSTPTPLARPAATTELRWPALAGFRTETLPFPLDFAPEIVHRGVEQIRFFPGWGDPKATDYFTYAFTWLLEPPARLDGATLKSDLQVYFKGLMRSVSAAKHAGREPFSTFVRVDRGRPPREEPNFPVRPSYRAQVQTWDAFHDRQKLLLSIDIFEPKSPVAGRLLYYFEVSPNLEDSGVRSNFLRMRRQLEL